jgi:hypothetical protein
LFSHVRIGGGQQHRKLIPANARNNIPSAKGSCQYLPDSQLDIKSILA